MWEAYLFCQKGYVEDKSLDLGTEPPRLQNLV